ncbi:hypothetical protein GCM10009716_46160 [Streptomyces sodiiphilus]|uniref:Uncharacterized protein n=1 Tax=Streptomyces sodiiphilus TaxID=226217 RepID=A0ABN2PUT6_9ACTN
MLGENLGVQVEDLPLAGGSVILVPSGCGTVVEGVRVRLSHAFTLGRQCANRIASSCLRKTKAARAARRARRHRSGGPERKGDFGAGEADST